MTEPWTAKRRDELLTRTSRTTVLVGALAVVATAGLSYGLATATTLLAAGNDTAASTTASVTETVADPVTDTAAVTAGTDDDSDDDSRSSSTTAASTGTAARTATTTTTTPAATVLPSTSGAVATTGGS
jgi:hypothetical protein